jgi:hypothetical protein
MNAHSMDDELAAQPVTLQECAHPLQLAAMNAQSVDDELVTQQMMLQECAHPLQYAVMGDHLADELVAQWTKSRVLAHLQINSQSRGQGTPMD